MKLWRSGCALFFLTVWLAVTRVACAEIDLDGKIDQLGHELQSLRQLLVEGNSLGYALIYERADLSLASALMPMLRQKAQVGRVEEAATDVEFLLALVVESQQRARNVIAKRNVDVIVPAPEIAMVTRDGSGFRAGNQHIMFVGPMGYGPLDRQRELMSDLGFNVIGADFDSYASFMSLRDDGAIPSPVLDRIKASWDDLGKRNQAVVFLPSLHYVPRWLLDRHPEIQEGGPIRSSRDWSGIPLAGGAERRLYGSFFPFSIDATKIRDATAAYFSGLLPTLKAAHILKVYTLMNEPTYEANSDATYRGAFLAYLSSKFASIYELNLAWGTAYGSFADIGARPSGRHPGLFDWYCFHQKYVSDWFALLAAQIRNVDPDALLSNKPQAFTLFAPSKGNDFERQAEILDILGSDAERKPTDLTYAYAWSQPTILYDFQRSVSPAKPLADLELHFAEGAGVNERYTQAVFWQAFLHGVRLATFWVWDPGSLSPGSHTGAGMRNTVATQPRAAWGASRAALDLRRLAGLVSRFPVPPQVGIYYCRASLYLDTIAYRHAVIEAYEALNGLDAPTGFVTDAMLQTGRLGAVKLLLVPGASYAEEASVRAIRAFVKTGGTVIQIGEAFSKDEYRALRPTEARPSAIKVASADAKGLAPVLDRLLDETGVSRDIRLRTQVGTSAWPVEFRCVEANGRICYVLGLNKAQIDAQIVGASPIRGWEDLISGDTATTSKIVIEPQDVRLIRLL